MPECRYNLLTSAYHDGELNEHDHRIMADHLPACPACSAELAELAQVSSVFAAHAQDRSTRLSQIELARLHQQLQPDRIAAGSDAGKNAGIIAGISAGRQAGEPSEIMRIAGLLSALAASVLIVSAAWLYENPTRHPDPVSPAGSGVSVLDAPAWERVAMTLKVDQRPDLAGDQTGFARADNDRTDLMLGLAQGNPNANGGSNHANP